MSVSGTLETEYQYAPGEMVVIDPLGRVITKSTDTVGGDIDIDGFLRGAWETDPLGREISRTDSAGLTLDYDYDYLGRLVHKGYGATAACMDPATRAVNSACANDTYWSYDLSGRMLSKTLANGVTTEIERDGVGRPTKMFHDDGSSRVLITEQAYAPYAAGSSLPTVYQTFSTFGVTESVTRDGLGRVHTKSGVAGLSSTTYSAGDLWPVSQSDENGIVTGYTPAESG